MRQLRCQNDSEDFFNHNSKHQQKCKSYIKDANKEIHHFTEKEKEHMQL